MVRLLLLMVGDELAGDRDGGVDPGPGGVGAEDVAQFSDGLGGVAKLNDGLGRDELGLGEGE